MKRYFTDLFDNLSYDTTSVFSHYTVGQPVDAMTKQRIYNRVMANIAAEQARQTAPAVRPKLRLSKVSVAAAACAAVMVVGSAGVGAAKMYKGFTDYMPAYIEAQKEIVSKAAFSINKSMGSDGLTATAVEGMCDGEKLFVLANLEIDPSQVTVADSAAFYTRLRLHTTGDPNDTQGMPCEYLNVLERSGNACTVLYAFDLRDVTDGQTLGLEANGLFARSGDDVVALMDADTARWGLTFDVKKDSFAKAFSLDRGIQIDGTDVSAMAGYLAPWYARFVLNGDFAGNIPMGGSEEAQQTWDAYAQQIEVQMSSITFQAVMKDGTVHTGVGKSVSENESGLDQADGVNKSFEYACSFREYVDTNAIDHLEINGVKVNLA